MKNIFVFTGDSGSGKTTIINKLVEIYPNLFKKLVTYTSRPMRKNEIDGKDYHFLPKSFFVNNPDLILVKEMKPGEYYGTKRNDMHSATHHLLLTSKPSGVSKLTNLGFKNIIVVYIEISVELKTLRMRQRGDNEALILERLKSDHETIKKTFFGSEQVIQLNANQSINEMIDIITKAC